MTGSGCLLAIDTATKRAALALALPDGRTVGRSWVAGYRHGEELLTTLDGLLRGAGIMLRDVSGVVVGIGPGAFTGLRVGLATAKGLAYGLAVPIAGIASTAAIAHAFAGVRAVQHGEGSRGQAVAVVLPAGPRDRYLARYRIGSPRAPGTRAGAGGPPQAPGTGGLAWPTSEPEPLGEPLLVPGGAAIEPLVGEAAIVAVDVAPGSGIPEGAVSAGHAAQDHIGESLLVLGRWALVSGHAADVAELVPAYVALPRGVTEQVGTIEWSRDLP